MVGKRKAAKAGTGTGITSHFRRIFPSLTDGGSDAEEEEREGKLRETEEAKEDGTEEADVSQVNPSDGETKNSEKDTEKITLTVMKYDKMLDKERHSAAIAGPKRLEARKLSNVRWWLINNKALDSRQLADLPPCTSAPYTSMQAVLKTLSAPVEGAKCAMRRSSRITLNRPGKTKTEVMYILP
jgi:hypothetical protein